MNKEEKTLTSIINLLLAFIDNDEQELEIKDKCHFRGMLLYLINLERGFTGWCSNPNCSCSTKNRIKKYLEDERLTKFLTCYGRNYKDDILSIIEESE